MFSNLNCGGHFYLYLDFFLKKWGEYLKVKKIISAA